MSKHIRGIGVDLCGIDRMEALKDDPHFLARYFTEEETAYVRSKGVSAAQSLASLFAAREALAKAMGTGISFSMKEAAVSHTESGQPFYALTGKLAERLAGCTLHLSLTHEQNMAAAFCIIEENDPEVNG